MAAATWNGETCTWTPGQLDNPLKSIFISQIFHTLNPTSVEYGHNSFPTNEMVAYVSEIQFLSSQWNGTILFRNSYQPALIISVDQ